MTDFQIILRLLKAERLLFLFLVVVALLSNGCETERPDSKTSVKSVKPTNSDIEEQTAKEKTVESVRSESPSVAGPNGVLLRYRFKTGEQLRWNVLQSQRIVTTVKGRSVTIETTSRSTKLWKVVNSDDEGNTTFEYSVDNVSMTQSQTDEEDARYDSGTDTEIPPKFSNLEGMIGVPLAHLTIDSLGETKKKVALRNYGAASQENRIAVPLPKNPIKVGESWTIDMPIELNQPDGKVKKIRARQKFTLDSYKTGLAKISYVSQIITPLEAKEEAQILDKYSRGKMELDLDSGHLISQESTVDKRVVGFQGVSDNVHHLTRFMECCCGLKSCDICSKQE